MTKALSLQQIGKKHVEGFALESRTSVVKGVIYGVSAEITMEELAKGIEEVNIIDTVRIRVFRDGEKHDSLWCYLSWKKLCPSVCL